MALDREPTLTQGNIQGTPFHLIQKGEILQRYTCESKTLRVKVQHHPEKWELCLVCQHSFNLTIVSVFGLDNYTSSYQFNSRSITTRPRFAASTEVKHAHGSSAYITCIILCVPNFATRDFEPCLWLELVYYIPNQPMSKFGNQLVFFLFFCLLVCLFVCLFFYE